MWRGYKFFFLPESGFVYYDVVGDDVIQTNMENGEKKKKLPEIPLLALLSFDAKYSKLNIDIRQLFINKCPMKLHLFEQKTFVS